VNRLKELFPYVGPLIGLTGFITALYFHAQSVQERVPTFYVSPQRAVIVDARGPTASSLQVLYHGKPVGASVTAVTVYFWNDGRLPIRKDDVLGDPVSIDSGGDTEILEARLIKVSRPVTKFEIASKESAKNSLPISFDILEKSDGAAVQIIYAGDPEAAITVKGTVIGAATPRLLGLPTGGFRKPRDPKRERISSELLGYAGLLTGSGSIVTALALRARTKVTQMGAKLQPSEPIRRMATFALALSTVLIILSCYLLYVSHRESSPGVPASIWSES
jgi:hypothetical protein